MAWNSPPSNFNAQVLAWLYALAGKKISPTASEVIEHATDLLIAPMTLLEIDFIRDIDRISVDSKEIYAYLHRQIGLNLCDRNVANVAAMAATQSWTRSPNYGDTAFTVPLFDQFMRRIMPLSVS